MDDSAEPVQRQLPIVLAAVGALVAGALWILAIVLPYAELGESSVSLLDGDATVTAAVVAPRVVGLVLVTGTALITLVVRGRSGPWWTTCGALLGLLAFSAYWWTGSIDVGTGAHHGIAWYLDGLACLLALGVLLLGASGARDRSGRPRPRSTPYMAVGTAVSAGVVLGLMTRNDWYLPALTWASGAIWGDLPVITRVVTGMTAALVVVIPVLATLARSRSAATGIAVGWLALLAPFVAHVVALRDVTPDHLGTPFVTGCLLAGLTAVAIVTWASVADRPDPPTRTPAGRRAREGPAPLER